MFELQKGSINNGQPDNYEFLLNACNSKLSNWATHWAMEMKRGPDCLSIRPLRSISDSDLSSKRRNISPIVFGIFPAIRKP